MALASSLVDDFTADAALGAAWILKAGGTATFGGGMTLAAASSSTVDTATVYDLTSSAFVIHLANGNYSIYVGKSDHTSGVTVFDGAASSTLSGARLQTSGWTYGYNAALADPWLAIRESGGVIFLDTSVDGVTWVNRAQLLNPGFTVTQAFLELTVHTAAASNVTYLSVGKAAAASGQWPTIYPVTATASVASPTFQLTGDDINNPIVITGSGSRPMNLAAYEGRQAAEPAYQAGDDGTARAWFTYTPTSPCTVTFATDNTTYDTVVEVYIGSSASSLSLYDWNDNDGSNVNSSIDCVLASGQQYWIRVHQKLLADAAQAFDFNWTAAARVATMQLSMRGGTTIPNCPASLRIDVLNGDANANVSFTVDSDPTVVGTGTLNAVGVANGLPVLLAAYLSGNHVLKVTETSSGTQTGSLDFTVTSDPAAIPPPQPPDNIPPVTSTTRWKLIDPAPGGETYTLTHNPATMTTPRSPRVFTVEATTAPAAQGQALTWEGARRATQWSFSGTVQTTADIDAFERFRQLNHRVLLTDHEGNGYVLSVETLDAKPIRDKDHPKAQQYTVGCLIYDTFSAS